MCLEVQNTRLSLIAVMLSRAYEGVVFKVGLDGFRAFEVQDAYLGSVDKGGCVNILEVWRSK